MNSVGTTLSSLWELNNDIRTSILPETMLNFVWYDENYDENKLYRSSIVE